MNEKIIEMKSVKEKLSSSKHIGKKNCFPATNHDEDLCEYNVGWYKGHTESGIPYEAEIWEVDEEVCVGIIMPLQDFGKSRTITKQKSESNISDFTYETEYREEGVLHLGMVTGGFEDDLEILRAYVNILTSNNIITFTGDFENASVEYLIDVNGNDFARITISLRDINGVMAKCNLTFEPFDDKKVIKGKFGEL